MSEIMVFLDSVKTYDDLKPGELYLTHNGLFCKLEDGSSRSLTEGFFVLTAEQSRTIFMLDEKNTEEDLAQPYDSYLL